MIIMLQFANAAVVNAQNEVFKSTPLSTISSQHPQQRLSMAQTREVILKNSTRYLRESYLANGNRSDKWDKHMLAAMDTYLAFEKDNLDFDRKKELLPHLEAAAEAGCDDPHWYYFYVFAHDYKDEGDVYEMLKKAAQSIEETPNQDRFLSMIVHGRLGQMARLRKDFQTAKTANRYTRKIFLEYLEHDLPALGPDTGWVWAPYLQLVLQPSQLTDEVKQDLEKFYTQVGEIKTLPVWASAYMRSKGTLMWGWAARESDLSTGTFAERMKIYNDRWEIANHNARVAHRQDPTQPYAATLLIELNWGRINQPSPTYNPRYWFEQAVTAQIDFEEAYRLYSWGILPRWGGSIRMELDFVKECLNTNRTDVDIPRFMFYPLDLVMTELKSREELPPGNRLDILKLSEQYFSNALMGEKDPLVRRRLQHRRIYYPWMLNLPSSTKAAFRKLEQPYDENLPLEQYVNIKLPSAASLK